MRYGLLNADGVVLDVIEADAEFADGLLEQLDDDEVDTPLALDQVALVVGLDEDAHVGPGWSFDESEGWAEPVPSPEELEAATVAQAEADQRAGDDAWLAVQLDRARNGEELTPAERDRVELIRLARG